MRRQRIMENKMEKDREDSEKNNILCPNGHNHKLDAACYNTCISASFYEEIYKKHLFNEINETFSKAKNNFNIIDIPNNSIKSAKISDLRLIKSVLDNLDCQIEILIEKIQTDFENTNRK